MKLDALDHPKTFDLAARLGVQLPTALGHLELLWSFAGKQAAQGNIGKWPDGAIARACYWMGDPSEFISALVDSGFVDQDPEFRLTVHDWSVHAPGWVRAKLKKLGLYFISTATASSEATADRKKRTLERTREPSSEPSSRAHVCIEGKSIEGKGLSLSEGTSVGSDVGGRETDESQDRITPEARLAIQLREAGVKVSSIHPTLVGWVRDKFTQLQCMQAVAIAREALGPNEHIHANYLDKILRSPTKAPRHRAPNGTASHVPRTDRKSVV